MIHLSNLLTGAILISLSAIAVSCSDLNHDSRNMSLLLARASLLSGSSLTACDPSPNVSTCFSGLASVTLIARQHAKSINTTMIFVPRLDSLSAVTRMHPEKVGVNLLMYQRIRDQYTNNNTGVNIMDYMVDPTAIVNGGSAFLNLLHAATFKPLSTSTVPPPYSAWRYVVQVGRVIDLTTMAGMDVESVVSVSTPPTTPKCAILFDDDSDNLWTTSSFVSPLSFGYRVNATYHKANAFDGITDAANTFSGARVVAENVATLRAQVGFVIMISEDNSIPAVDLLADMLALEIENEYMAQRLAAESHTTPTVTPSHVPDIHYQSDIGRSTHPYPVDITATYVAFDGTVITKTRSVLIAEMLDDSTGSLDLEFNLTAVRLSAGSAGGAYTPSSMLGRSFVRQFDENSKTLVKDSIYFEDQVALLGYSRAALQNDPTIGRTIDPMPPVTSGSDNVCYSGECAQGTLVTRAIQWALNTDVSFIASDSPRGNGWPAGNVTFLLAYGVYPWPHLPCRATITGLRLWQIVAKSLEAASFSPTANSAGDVYLQLHNIKVEYALGNGIYKPVSISVLNRTTGVHEPLDRLRYYTVATTNNECVFHSVYTPLLRSANLYRGESVFPMYRQEPLQQFISNFLGTYNPYTPILENYLTAIASSEITSGARTFLSFPVGLSACASTQFFDPGLATCFDCPPGEERSSADVSQCSTIPIPADRTPLIVGVSIGGTVLLIIITLGVVWMEVKRRANSRSNSNAPKGGGDVAIVFTDIQSSTKLWGAAPLSMGVALDAHHSIIRKAISEHQSYEVKTVGDSFMIAVQSAQAAVNLAVAIQVGLYDASWPSAIDDAYDCNFQDFDFVDDPDDLYGPEEGAPWNGLRVRIGVHYGPVEAVLDPVTKGFDYYGPTVNVAARVEGVTEGGQIIVSSSVMDAIQPNTVQYTSGVLASVALRGVRDEVQVHKITPNTLGGRVFKNPLIFDSRLKTSNVFQQSQLMESTTNDLGTSIGTIGSQQVTETPLNANTRPIYDIVREACKAIRGSERTRFIETLRKSWRVQLPSGGPFTGIDTLGKPEKRRSRSSTNRASLATLDPASRTDENDEEIIFRVVAQRVAPSVVRVRKSDASHNEDLQQSGSVSFKNREAEEEVEMQESIVTKPLVTFMGTQPAWNSGRQSLVSVESQHQPGANRSVNSSVANLTHSIECQSSRLEKSGQRGELE